MLFPKYFCFIAFPKSLQSLNETDETAKINVCCVMETPDLKIHLTLFSITLSSSCTFIYSHFIVVNFNKLTVLPQKLF